MPPIETIHSVKQEILCLCRFFEFADRRWNLGFVESVTRKSRRVSATQKLVRLRQCFCFSEWLLHRVRITRCQYSHQARLNGICRSV